MKNKCAQTALASILLAGFLVAQTPGTPPTAAEMAAHQVSRLTALLTLTTAQQTQATTIFTTEQTAVASVRTSMQVARTALLTAVEANDAGGITTQATQIGALTVQEVQEQSTAEAALFAILTADQQTKYKALLAGGPGGSFGGRERGGPPMNE